MPLYLKHKNPLFAIWQIEERSDELLALLRNPAYYLSDLERLSTEKRRQEWLASRVLLEYLSDEPARIAYHPNGAPYLIGNRHFVSISHTKGYAALLLQDRPEAGIDIEYCSDRIIKLRNRFMSAEEEQGIDKAQEANHLLLHWCAKETLYKMIGQEGVDWKEQLHVKPFSYAESGFFQVYETCSPEQKCYDLEFLVTAHFVLTWRI